MFLSNDQITKTNFLSLLSSFVPFDKHPLDSNLFFPFDWSETTHQRNGAPLELRAVLNHAPQRSP
jgi:hypothetical protein